MSEVRCNFFAESLLCTWSLHFWENIFILGPKSVSRFSYNTPQKTYLLNIVSAIFSEIFIFHQMAALQKLWKMFSISFQNPFSSWDFQKIFYLPGSHFLKSWSKINLKFYDVFNCLKKNFRRTQRYDIEPLAIDTVLDKEHFIEKSYRKWAPKASPRLLFSFGKQPKTVMPCKKFFLK